MKRLLGGGVACALTLVGSVVLAGPGSAGQAPLQASITPSVIEPGGRVDIDSVDPCFGPGTAGVPGDVFFELVLGGEVVNEFTIPATADGHWSMSYVWGSTDQPGDYTVEISCRPAGETGPNYRYETLRYTLLDEPEPVWGLTMAITPVLPATAASGGPVTLRSIKACPRTGEDFFVGWEAWSLKLVGEDIELDTLVGRGTSELAGDGSWQASLAAPAKDGPYGLFAFCLKAVYDADTSTWLFPVEGVYDPQPLLVKTPGQPGPGPTLPEGPLPEVEAPTVTPQRLPAAATAVAARPRYTG